jgi:hypothetical protein
MSASGQFSQSAAAARYTPRLPILVEFFTRSRLACDLAEALRQRTRYVMERYDEAEISWLRFLGTPDHVLEFLKTEDGLHTGRAIRIAVRTVVSIFAVLLLFGLSGSGTPLAQQFPEAADAFLVWLSLTRLALLFVALLAGAASLSSLICLISGIGWRKAAGDLNVFAERVGELWLGKPLVIYSWRMPQTVIMMLLLRTVPRELSPIRFLTRLTVSRLFFWSIVTATLTAMTLNQISQPFQVLNTRGHFERDGTGAEHRDSWSELLRVEVGCSGRNERAPNLQLHFSSGRAVNLVRMSARRMSNSAAFARIDDIRRAQGVPIAWKNPAQRERFRDNSAPLVRCVDEMLNAFPQERRNALLALLRG